MALPIPVKPNILPICVTPKVSAMSTLIMMAMLLIPTVRVHTYVSHPEANPVMVRGKCIIEAIRAMPALLEPGLF